MSSFGRKLNHSYRATGSVTVRFPLNKSDVYSQGELVPNYEAKVMTPNGQDELGPNQPGEIWIRSPSIAQGYLKRPEITEKAFLPGGWFRTGDYGYYDVQHNWFIKDRVQVRYATPSCDAKEMQL